MSILSSVLVVCGVFAITMTLVDKASVKILGIIFLICTSLVLGAEVAIEVLDAPPARCVLQEGHTYERLYSFKSDDGSYAIVAKDALYPNKMILASAPTRPSKFFQRLGDHFISMKKNTTETFVPLLNK